MGDKDFYMLPDKTYTPPLTSEDIAAQVKAFKRAGGKIKLCAIGETAEQKSGGAFNSSERSKANAANANKIKGGRITIKQVETMHAIQRLADMPGVLITRQGVKNILKTTLSSLDERLIVLERKGYIRRAAGRIELLARMA